MPLTKNIFLLDGLGALLSAFSLGVLLTTFQSIFGMPLPVLYGLSLVAGLFAVYSLGCHFFSPHNWRPFLRSIAVANVLYACLSLGMVVCFYDELTAWGVGYFGAELLVLLALVALELRTLAK